MLDHAKRYAALGWPVFRLTGYKTPLKGSHGFKDATVDANVIDAWWGGGGRVCNIGLATGMGAAPVVVDADGEVGLAELKALAKAHGGLPRTLAARTGNGWHFYFMAPSAPRGGDAGPGGERVVLKSHNAPRTHKGAPGIDLKGVGGYVVLPPSVNARTDAVYQWVNWGVPIAEMPAWLVDYWLARRAARKAGAGANGLHRGPFRGMGTIPAWCAARERSAAGRALQGIIAGELPSFLQALRRLDANCGYDQWFRIGASIFDFDAGELGLTLFKKWSASAPGYREEADEVACEAKWREYGLEREAGAPVITKATVYGLARDAKGGDSHTPVGPEQNHTGNKTQPAVSDVLEPQADDVFGDGADRLGAGGKVNGHPPSGGLPAVFTHAHIADIHFPDVNADGEPTGTTTNAGCAVRGLGIICRKDVFHEKMMVGGQAIDQWGGDLSDDAVVMARKVVKHAYGFDPGEKNMRDALVQLCLEHQFNPVVDYLDALEWDGVERIGRWVVDYLGAEDTALNKEFGRLMLIAAVRRARRPGTKFDQIIVLEGKEGTNKSTALKILSGEDNFSDQNILTASDREQQEAVCGVWIYEIAELAGMRRADIERVKQFASRTEDRARPAYGRLRIDRKRQCVFVGTTNKDVYLQSETGNRRFWSIATGHIDIVKLRAARDQLWAEAAHMERRGELIELNAQFWDAVGEIQDARRESEPWAELIGRFLAGKEGAGETSVTQILQVGLRFEPAQINQVAQNRVARVLRDMKWERYQKRVGDAREWHYRAKRP